MRHRDIAYFTREQIQARSPRKRVIPAFVIEVISESDQSYRVEEKQSYRVEEKIVEYFKAGVEVVWNIYPEQEVVYVYTSRQFVSKAIFVQ